MASTDNELVPVCILQKTLRSEQLHDAFVDRFEQEPTFYVRVPGRVNLIGEHIDYCGYGVCPMAIEQDIFLAVGPQKKEKLKLINLDCSYPDYECDIKEISIDAGPPPWFQYFLCGVKGMIEAFPEDISVNKGFNVIVSGTIPQSAGLSSSSALVSAAALATAHIYNFPVSKKKIANLCAECEHYIGTQGGGMDQAIAFLATEGCAKLIEFNPLRSKDVVLPKGAVFVIAHSLSRLNKAATADYNCRVVECRLAAQIIAKNQGLEWTNIRRLGDVQQALGIDLNIMISLVERILHVEPYNKDEILGELETSLEKLDQVSVTQNTKHIQSFKLKQRALHVFEEALRVEKFHETCNESGLGEGALQILGRLMRESHESLRDLYECSHPQLDKLVEMSHEFTFGARLTGAGWGGCVVALVPPENVEKYIDMLQSKFYRKLGVTENFQSLVFKTSPNSGACIYKID